MKFLGVIGFLIVLVWYVPAMIWGAQITKAMEGGDSGALASLLDGPAPLAWWRNRSELNETFSTDELNLRRYVSYELRVPFTELLNPGEVAPEDVFLDLYAQARTPARLIAFCPEVLDRLATRCDVTHTTARIDRDGTARLEGLLVYSPAYDMGDPSTVKSGDVFSGAAMLGSYEENAEGRAEVFTKALTICDGLREAYGNCVISKLSFSAPGWDGKANAHASFDVYADKSQNDRNSVQARVEQVAAAVLGATQ